MQVDTGGILIYILKIQSTLGHLSFYCEKVKVHHVKVNTFDYHCEDKIINLTQFDATIWAKHNTQ